MKTSKTFFPAILFLYLAVLSGSCRQAEKPDSSNSEKQRAYTYQDKAIAFRQGGNPDSAYYYFGRSRVIFEASKDSVQMVFTLLQLADICKEFNDYNEMQALTVEALPYLGSKSGALDFASCYNNLGITHRHLNQYNKAIAYYAKGLRYAQDSLDKIRIRNNMANTLIDAGKPQKARSLLVPLLESSITRADTTTFARILDNEAFAAGLSKTDDSAATRLADALSLRKKVRDTTGMITSFMHLSAYYADSHPLKAVEFAMEAEKLSAKRKATDDRLEALRFLMLHSTSPDKYVRDFLQLSDSIMRIRQSARNHFAMIRYDYKREREKRIQSEAQATLKIARQQTRALAFGILAIAILVVSSVVVRNLLKSRRRVKQKASYETEVRLAAKLHDELANDIHQAIVFTETRQLDDEQAKNSLLEKLDAIYKSARDISRDANTVPNLDDFTNALRELLQRYDSMQCRVIAQGIDSVNWPGIDKYKKIEIYRILQELLANMQKHSGCTRALFEFSCKRKLLLLKYADDGAFKKETQPSQKNGLLIMENRISQLKGSVTFEPGHDKGFRVVIQIPI